MGKEWLSINGLAAATGIPESTTRRYIRTYGRYLSSNRASGKFRRYAAASVPILEQISALYQAGKEREEIEALLQATQPITVEEVELSITTNPTPSLQAVLSRIADALERLDHQGELERRIEALEKTKALTWWGKLFQREKKE